MLFIMSHWLAYGLSLKEKKKKNKTAYKKSLLHFVDGSSNSSSAVRELSAQMGRLE